MNRKPLIGLVGGIGSGKSTVAAAFAQHGGRVIVADALGHEALRQPAIKEKVIARWGSDVLDGNGEVDRRKIARIVFAKENAGGDELRALESMVFPYIGRRILEEVQAAEADPKVRLIVLDAAVMLEAGWNKVCDRLVYVHTPRAERLRRLKDGRGWSPKEVEDRESAQLSLTEKVTRADRAVDNTGPPGTIAAQVETLIAQWGLTGA